MNITQRSSKQVVHSIYSITLYIEGDSASSLHNLNQIKKFNTIYFGLKMQISFFHIKILTPDALFRLHSQDYLEFVRGVKVTLVQGVKSQQTREYKFPQVFFLIKINYIVCRQGFSLIKKLIVF
ncbi:hypothetical protein TTHERM_000147532 (macronuclear) [Tetrahymena thermophila SB210]|uniref:Uncharacterized protein n=1 Tax=Tetrahymena thermophila (strain SB210) TaxID=312017 RepID=W7X9E3_TETTS|nr:hypothetical protein TTHERM_000147532 [Tetrahymena thermophila SB210]EWS73008.1 hypothetical protein TTHERM_000147532 [Tetrahymena thermophila SB210]|eukprot:XP_012654405.1 hypothetical protein TTHERM_000147532 [Tetrahymena thermophila SB210]